MVRKEQCFLLPVMILFHALPMACLKPFNKPFPGSSEGSSEGTSPLCSEIAQVMPSILTPNRQICLSFPPEPIFLIQCIWIQSL